MNVSSGSKPLKSFQDLKAAVLNGEVAVSPKAEKQPANPAAVPLSAEHCGTGENSREKPNSGELSSKKVLPELPDFDQMEKAIQAAEEQAKQIDREMATVKEWLPSAIGKIEQLQKRLRTASGKVRDELERQVKTLRKAIDDLIYHDDRECRRSARRVYFVNALSAEPENTLEVLKILRDLFGKGLLEESSGKEAPFSLDDKKLVVASDCGFDEEETRQIVSLFKEMTGKVRAHIQEDRQQRAVELRNRSEISLQDVRKGKDGFCCLEVPAEKKFQGGVLLIRAEGERIYPVNASGGFEYAIREAAEMRIGKEPAFLKRLSIGLDRCPPQLQWMGGEKAKKFFLLWNLIQRVLLREAEQTLIQEELKAFQDKATAGAEAFFLDGAIGAHCVEFQGPWLKDGWEVMAENVFALIDRSETETGTVISILAIPIHLDEQGFFGELQTYVPYEEGEGFNSLPQPLKAVLQATYRQVKHSAEKTE